MDEAFRLIPCDADGRPVEPVGELPAALRQACAASAALYARVGHRPPWVSYVAFAGSTPVGGGAFVGPPQDGRVEIAYFTLDAHRQRGHATRTARALCTIALRAPERPLVFGKTLPAPDASTRILRGLGFVQVGEVADHEVGTVWLWERPAHGRSDGRRGDLA